MASSDTSLAPTQVAAHASAGVRAPFSSPSSSSPPKNAAGGDEWLQVMDRCFGQLDQGHQRILTLRTRFNLSYEEIAAELQTQVDSVREGMMGAREHLRALLLQHSPEFAREEGSYRSAAG